MAKGGFNLDFKVLGLFGIILLTSAITYKFTADTYAVPTYSVTNLFVEVREITPNMKGLTRETRGIVTELSESKGHVFFTLKDAIDNTKIRGVMFAKTNNDNPERKKILIQSRDNNSVVYIKGKIDIYKGELEIKAWQVFNDD